MASFWPTVNPDVLVTGTVVDPAGTVIGPSGCGCHSGGPALATVASLPMVASRPLPDEARALGPDCSSNLYDATFPAPACPPASAVSSASESAWSKIWKSSTVAPRYGSGYCERPIQFCWVFPRLAGCSVMLG